jgi:hypothetical protein
MEGIHTAPQSPLVHTLILFLRREPDLIGTDCRDLVCIARCPRSGERV